MTGNKETAAGSGFLRFWASSARASLTRAAADARGGACEAQVREALKTVDRLLKDSEDEADAAGDFLPRVSPRRGGLRAAH